MKCRRVGSGGRSVTDAAADVVPAAGINCTGGKVDGVAGGPTDRAAVTDACHALAAATEAVGGDLQIAKVACNQLRSRATATATSRRCGGC